MTKPSEQFLYRGQPAEVRPAEGVMGLLLRAIGNKMFLRVRTGNDITDYEILHDDLRVTIDPNEMVSFYKVGDD